MGIFDFLIDSSNKKTTDTRAVGAQQTNQNVTGTTTGTTTQNTNQSNTSSNTSKTDQSTQQQSTTNTKNVISNLDPATQALLQALAPTLAANATTSANGGAGTNATALQGIASALYDKATGADVTNITDAINAGTAGAKLAYQTGEGQQIAGVQQQIGSKNNTFSQLIANKGSNDLNTQIAEIIAQAQLAGNQQISADLTGAASVLGTASGVAATDAASQLNPLLALVSALKGATTTSAGTEAQTGSSSTAQNTSSQNIEQILSQILGTSNQTADTTSVGTVQSAEQQKSTATQKDVPSILLTLFGSQN